MAADALSTCPVAPADRGRPQGKATRAADTIPTKQCGGRPQVHTTALAPPHAPAGGPRRRPQQSALGALAQGPPPPPPMRSSCCQMKGCNHCCAIIQLCRADDKTCKVLAHCAHQTLLLACYGAQCEETQAYTPSAPQSRSISQVLHHSKHHIAACARQAAHLQKHLQHRIHALALHLHAGVRMQRTPIGHA